MSSFLTRTRKKGTAVPMEDLDISPQEIQRLRALHASTLENRQRLQALQEKLDNHRRSQITPEQIIEIDKTSA